MHIPCIYRQGVTFNESVFSSGIQVGDGEVNCHCRRVDPCTDHTARPEDGKLPPLPPAPAKSQAHCESHPHPGAAGGSPQPWRRRRRRRGRRLGVCHLPDGPGPGRQGPVSAVRAPVPRGLRRPVAEEEPHVPRLQVAGQEVGRPGGRPARRPAGFQRAATSRLSSLGMEPSRGLGIRIRHKGFFERSRCISLPL